MKRWVGRVPALILSLVFFFNPYHSSRSNPSSSAVLALFSYDDLLELYQEDTPSQPLEEKLDRLRTTPVVKNNATAHVNQRAVLDSTGSGKSLRVASWNIEEGLEFDTLRAPFLGPQELEKTLDHTKFPDGSKERQEVLVQSALLKDADVIILNEVDWGMKRTGYRNVAADLAAALGMNYAWGLEFVEVDPVALGVEQFEGTTAADRAKFQERTKVDRSRYLGLHGNAILSRYRLDNVRLMPFQFNAYDWYHNEKTRPSMIQKGKDKAGEEIFLERQCDRSGAAGGAS